MKEQLIHFENEAGFQALFQHATVGIIVSDQEGKMVIVNPMTEKLFGYDKQELIGKDIEILIPKPYRSRHVDYRHRYSDNPQPREMGSGRDLFALKKNGDQFPVEISLSSYLIQNERLFVAFITDITEQKNYTQKLEDIVAERTQQLQRSLDKERELSDLKSKFISIASHEFRTPLSTILSSAGLIEKYIERKDENSQLKHTKRIKSSVHGLSNILSDFLSLEKLEEGMVQNNPVNFCIRELLEEVLTELDSLLKNDQKIDLRDEIQSSEVYVDKGLLKACLVNLLSNAIKYSEESSTITLEVECGESLHLSVMDQGIGIPLDDQKSLFNRFFRASNVGNIKGTGLGLNIIKRYLEIMGGNISFESIPDAGTTFFANIPLDTLNHIRK